MERLPRRICSRFRRLAVMAGIFFVALSPANAFPPEGMDEAFLQFRYRGVVDTFISGLSDGERVYLPMLGLFDHLRINATYDNEVRRIEGFFINQWRRYSIDLSAGVAHFDERIITFSEDDFIATELEVYFVPDFYAEMFGLDFTVNIRRLMLALSATETLPIILERERERRRDQVEIPHLLREEEPLVFDRDRRLLGVGILDYTWTSQYAGDDLSHSYSLFGGVEFLGGDLHGAVYGSTGADAFSFSTDHLRWRYVFDPNPVLTRFYAGGLLSTGLESKSHHGVRLTNEPVQPRRIAGFYRLHGRAEPGWNVELYINNQLVGSETVGPLGDYIFEIPIGYGTQQTTLRFYGPMGEFEEVERQFLVPFRILPAGEVNYWIDAGQTIHEQRNLAQARVDIGVSERLTAGFGIDYMEGFRDEDFVEAIPYHTINYRLGDGHFVTIDNAPDALQRLGLSAFYANQISWDAQVTRFQDHPFYGPLNARAEALGNFYMPFSPRGHPMIFRFRGRALDLRERETEYFYNPEIDIWHREIIYSFGVEELRGNRQSETFLVGGFRYLFRQPDFLRNLILRTRYSYNLRRSRSEELRIDMSRPITRASRFRVGWRHEFAREADHVELSFTYDFPVSRSTTTYQRRAGAGSIVQTFRGSIAYDPAHRRFIGSHRPMVGSAAVAFRAFVDFEGDGAFTEGDEIIRDRIVRFREPLPTRFDPDGVFRAYNLAPYRQYSVTIDQERVRNPLWVPSVKSFSFIADPNRFKPIDLPFHVSGVIEGTALRVRNGRTEPVAGLRLLLEQTDGPFTARIPVLTDGSYFQMGVPPGNYKLRIDPVQLESLRSRSEPEVHEFEVRVTREGDFLDGINFQLLE